MKEINLTQGKVALVSDEDYDYLSQFKWHCSKCRNNYYAARTVNMNGKSGHQILMHKEIMPCDKSMVVDHIDHNGLNNQRENLRICTYSQNACNYLKKKNNKCGYKGIYFNKLINRWFCQIKCKDIYFRQDFDKLEDAILAYNEKARELHGEFACIN